MFAIGSFAIIFDDQGRVLLCHRRDSDVWTLPGGGVESGEMPTEAVIREVMEETGLDVEITRLVGVYGKVGKDEFVFSFICHITGGSLTLTDESNESSFFEADNLPTNTSPKHAERIHDAVVPSSEPYFYRQSGPSTQEMLKEMQKKTKKRAGGL